MNENLKNFLSAISSDLEWVAKQKDLSKEEGMKSALAKAAELGIPLTEADFEAPEGELSEDELVAVAGAGNCYCVMGGGGTEGDADNMGCDSFGFVDQVCWCVVYGEGWKDRYNGYSGDYIEEEQRCECPMVGNGY